MAKSPDPNIKLTSSKGVTRTLDDWATIFQLCLVVLPPRPEAGMFVPIARRISNVLGDSDCRIVYCVLGDEFIARGVLGDAEREAIVLTDPDGSFVNSLGLTHSPRWSTCARTRPSSTWPRVGTPPPGSASSTASPRPSSGAAPPSPVPATRRPPRAGPSPEPAIRIGFPVPRPPGSLNSRSTHLRRNAADRVPGTPRITAIPSQFGQPRGVRECGIGGHAAATVLATPLQVR